MNDDPVDPRQIEAVTAQAEAPAVSARSQDAGPNDPVRLADPTPCVGPGCGITRGEWSGLPFFQCGVCGFETFNEGEADTRAKIAGDLSGIAAN